MAPLFVPFNFCFTGLFNILELPATAVRRLRAQCTWARPALSLWGTPGAQVPLGLDRRGLPLGVQVVANEGQDKLCVAVVRTLTPAHPRQQLVLTVSATAGARARARVWRLGAPRRRLSACAHTRHTHAVLFPMYVTVQHEVHADPPTRAPPSGAVVRITAAATTAYAPRRWAMSTLLSSSIFRLARSIVPSRFLVNLRARLSLPTLSNSSARRSYGAKPVTSRMTSRMTLTRLPRAWIRSRGGCGQRTRGWPGGWRMGGIREVSAHRHTPSRSTPIRPHTLRDVCGVPPCACSRAAAARGAS
jgi:hypothetical protein